MIDLNCSSTKIRIYITYFLSSLQRTLKKIQKRNYITFPSESFSTERYLSGNNFSDRLRRWGQKESWCIERQKMMRIVRELLHHPYTDVSADAFCARSNFKISQHLMRINLILPAPINACNYKIPHEIFIIST